MSVVTNFQAVPSRLLSVYATVAEAENGVLRDHLASWATPPSLSKRGGGDEDDWAVETFHTREGYDGLRTPVSQPAQPG